VAFAKSCRSLQSDCFHGAGGCVEPKDKPDSTDDLPSTSLVYAARSPPPVSLAALFRFAADVFALLAASGSNGAALCLPSMAQRPSIAEVIASPSIGANADHFFNCPWCGTWIDCRHLGEVLPHEDWCTAQGNTTPMPGRATQ
jgi:hypothetical protein